MHGGFYKYESYKQFQRIRGDWRKSQGRESMRREIHIQPVTNNILAIPYLIKKQYNQRFTIVHRDIKCQRPPGAWMMRNDIGTRVMKIRAMVATSWGGRTLGVSVWPALLIVDFITSEGCKTTKLQQKKLENNFLMPYSPTLGPWDCKVPIQYRWVRQSHKSSGTHTPWGTCQWIQAQRTEKI
jgi:hypothetical protein